MSNKYWNNNKNLIQFTTPPFSLPLPPSRSQSSCSVRNEFFLGKREDDGVGCFIFSSMLGLQIYSHGENQHLIRPNSDSEYFQDMMSTFFLEQTKNTDSQNYGIWFNRLHHYITQKCQSKWTNRWHNSLYSSSDWQFFFPGVGWRKVRIWSLNWVQKNGN